MFCLRYSTTDAWVKVASTHLDEILVDHAHCELKAATTALSLATKCHTDLGMVQQLSALAAEEVNHFQRVVRWLEQRSLKLGVPSVNRYAALLHGAVQALPPARLDNRVDRLLIGALIEARSCERFKALLDSWPEHAPAELHAFYRELFECEAGHYVTYCDLARTLEPTGRDAVEARLEVIAEAEAGIMRQLAAGAPTPTVHG